MLLWSWLLLLVGGAVRVAALTCGPGNYDAGAAGLANCSPCPAGAFCPAGATLPLLCPIGFVCPGLGLTFPQLCGGGQSYCPVTNLTSPLPCPTGNMSTPGASSCVTAVVSTLAGLGVPSFNDGAGTMAATFNFPRGVAVDASGNVLVADTNNHRVRRVTPRGRTFVSGATALMCDFLLSCFILYLSLCRSIHLGGRCHRGHWRLRRWPGRRGRLQPSPRCGGGCIRQRPGGGHKQSPSAARDAQRRCGGQWLGCVDL